ncbi:MAG: DbpA RNA binding domain-containing protein [Gammaproteobacteria bacterium]
MSLNQSDPVRSRHDEKLKKSVARIIQQEDLESWRSLVERMAAELNISYLDCAAALAQLNQSNRKGEKKPKPVKYEQQHLRTAPEFKKIRYRLEVGREHRVSSEEVVRVIVEETGVDKKQIGMVEVRAFHTLIDLPDGMPTDIYRHVKTVKINGRPLLIKRLDRDKLRTGKSFHQRRRGNRPPASPQNGKDQKT